jgi:hypothetical protein
MDNLSGALFVVEIVDYWLMNWLISCRQSAICYLLLQREALPWLLSSRVTRSCGSWLSLSVGLQLYGAPWWSSLSEAAYKRFRDSHKQRGRVQ